MINKSFLIGLGIGLLLATLTLQLDFLNQSPQNVSTELTVEQLREKAQEFEYELKTKREIELEIENAIEQYKNQQSSQSNSMKSNKRSSQKNDGNVNTKTATSKRVSIKKGWDATEAANYLFKQGIVTDRKALIRELVATEKTRQIPARTYNLEPNSDPELIAQIITASRP